MADLCGGHPADVLIAVCLAAKALTTPGCQGWGEVLCWLLGWWGWGRCCLRSSKAGDAVLGRPSGGYLCVPSWHACLCLVGHMEGMTKLTNLFDEVSP